MRKPRRSPQVRRILVLVPALSLLAGCASFVPSSKGDDGIQPGGQVLTSADIAQLGARDAMEAVERGSTHLRIQHTRAGTPVVITYRGVNSFVLNPEILVVVDGSRVSSPVAHLQGIPAASIRFIQILAAHEASAKWGSEAGNGVIVVVTSARVHQ